jgi:hypothetical protein
MHQRLGLVLRLRYRSIDDSRERLRPRGRLRLASRSLERDRVL